MRGDVIMKPFYSRLDIDKGILHDYDKKVERYLSDIKPYVKDKKTINKLITKKDELVYQVFQRDIPKEEGQLQHSITVIKSGNISGECYLTKGHYHSNPKSAEIYIGLKGNGVLVLQNGNKSK